VSSASQSTTRGLWRGPTHENANSGRDVGFLCEGHLRHQGVGLVVCLLPGVDPAAVWRRVVRGCMVSFRDWIPWANGAGEGDGSKRSKGKREPNGACAVDHIDRAVEALVVQTLGGSLTLLQSSR
jgi:hypothetical protein